MINSIKRLIGLSPKMNDAVSLGRWSIKSDFNKCNQYMLNLHADPGYVSPNKIIIKDLKSIEYKTKKTIK
tara:strand:- start:207 stop:416 length:210 start_codon:yes stop_codon:yes gene_type:complete